MANPERLNELNLQLNMLKDLLYSINNIIKKRDEKTGKNQQKFNNKILLDLSSKNIQKFYKQTTKNLTKIQYKDGITSEDYELIVDKLKNKYKEESSYIYEMMDLIVSHDINQTIINIVQKYKNVAEQKRIYKNYMETQKTEESASSINEKINVSNSQDLWEKYQEEHEQKFKQQLDFGYKTLMDGPKRKKIFSKEDLNLKDMEYLYGLAADVLILLTIDSVMAEKKLGENPTFRNADFYVNETEKQAVFEKYSVKDLDGLLNLYLRIREKYYKEYSKMNEKAKKNYKVSNFEHSLKNNLSKSIGNYSASSAMLNENFDFPPSRKEINNIINSRIISSGINFPTPTVQNEKEEIMNLEDRLNHENYSKIKKEFISLSRNMNEQEIIDFYKRVYYDYNKYLKDYSGSKDREYVAAQCSVVQRIFAEIIFSKRELKYLDDKQYEKNIVEICKECLYEYSNVKKEDMFVTEEEQEKRKQEIRKEYLKYRISLENPKEAISINDFIKTKYAIKDTIFTNEEINQIEQTSSKRR